jgi:endonuclease YncB( thermonuclease family)
MLLTWLAVSLVAFAAGMVAADSTLAWRERHGLTFHEAPLARPTLLPVRIGERYPATVLRVLDGDTLEAQWPDGARIRVRLTDIDAPESCQPYGTEAARVLDGHVGRGGVDIVVVDVDRNQRVIGRVFAAGEDVSAALVRDGAAWFYAEYARDDSLYALENDARDARRGLWALPPGDRMEPWEFRRNVRCPARR